MVPEMRKAMRLPLAAEAPVRLLVDLVAPEIVERLPDPATEDVMGLSLPRVRLAAFEASAPAKLRLALRAAIGDGAAWV